MISAQSGPIICMPITRSLSASTIIFMNPLASLPETVFFIGLQTHSIQRGWLEWHVNHDLPFLEAFSRILDKSQRGSILGAS